VNQRFSNHTEISQAYRDDVYSTNPLDNILDVEQNFDDNEMKYNQDGIGESSGGTCKCPDGREYDVGGFRKPNPAVASEDGDPCDALACENGISGTCEKENNNSKWNGKKMICGLMKTYAPIGQCQCPGGGYYNVGFLKGKTCNDEDPLACEGGTKITCYPHLPLWAGRKVTCGTKYGWGGKCTCPDGKTFDSGVKKFQNCGGASHGCENGTASECKEEIGVWSGEKIVCGYEKGTWGGDCRCPNGQIYKVGDNGNSCASLQCVSGVKENCSKHVDVSWKHKKVTCAKSTPEVCTDCWDKEDIEDANWPARRTYTAAKLVGVHPGAPFTRMFATTTVR
jgi:hypothetical protein